MSLLLVGLGNPGDQYRHTRHNAGRIVLSSRARDMAKVSDVSGSLWPLSRNSSLQGWLAQGTVEYEHGCYRVAIYFPGSYMNLSGAGTLKAMKYVGASVDQTLIVYDDADIPGSTTKLKQGGSHGGHNGLRDIFQHAGTNTFSRLKCGIGRPAHPAAGLHDHVLGQMTGDELEQWIVRPAGTDEKIKQRITGAGA